MELALERIPEKLGSPSGDATWRKGQRSVGETKGVGLLLTHADDANDLATKLPVYFFSSVINPRSNVSSSDIRNCPSARSDSRSKKDQRSLLSRASPGLTVLNTSPALSRRSNTPILLSKHSARVSTHSATASAFLPGTFITAMPSSWAVGASMESYPTPLRAMARR